MLVWVLMLVVLLLVVLLLVVLVVSRGSTVGWADATANVCVMVMKRLVIGAFSQCRYVLHLVPPRGLVAVWRWSPGRVTHRASG